MQDNVLYRFFLPAARKLLSISPTRRNISAVQADARENRGKPFMIWATRAARWTKSGTMRTGCPSIQLDRLLPMLIKLDQGNLEVPEGPHRFLRFITVPIQIRGGQK